MATYNLVNLPGSFNVIVFEIDGKNVFLDTGAPFSLARCPFSINNEQFNFPEGNGFVSVQTISDLIGMPLDIFIGTSILNKFDVRIRKCDNKIDIDTDIPDYAVTVPLSIIPGNGVIFPIAVAGRETNAFIDTGAHISYIDSSFVQNSASIRTEHDYNPLYGSFETNIYQLSTKIDHFSEITMEYGVLPAALSMMIFTMLNAMYNTSVIIGTALFSHYNCCISVPRKKISFEPY